MQEIIAGVALLLCLIGLQTGLRYWNVRRTRQAWNDAQAHMTRGDLDEAEEALARCVKLMPLWLQPRLLYGAVLAQQGKLESAEEHLKMVAELQPKEADGHIELGIFYVTAAQRMEDGVTAFRTALACGEEARRRIDAEPRLRDFRESDAYAQLEA
jgi:Flp pilus assembly protein TadD